jgi:hypothetical protein
MKHVIAITKMTNPGQHGVLLPKPPLAAAAVGEVSFLIHLLLGSKYALL